MASGRGNWADSVPNSADGIEGSIGNVGAPWDRKSDGIRFMAAKSAVSAARKLGCYQYKAALPFDKRVNPDLIASCGLSIGALPACRAADELFRLRVTQPRPGGRERWPQRKKIQHARYGV